MPIYEYLCGKCGQVMDALQRVTDPPPARCEHCGAKGKLTKMVSQTSFILRGGGWYADLYSSKKPETTSKPEGTAKDGKDGSKAAEGSGSPAPKSDAASLPPKKKEPKSSASKKAAK